MEDNPLFSTAADFVNNTSRHIFLTGKAGTGKTTFLKYIRSNTSKKAVVVAPTGVAAINAGGVTMHSFFQLPLGPFVPTIHRHDTGATTDQYTLFKNIRVSEEKRELFRDLELLIIDEVSMVRCDMLDATDAILRYFRKMPNTPFGGVQVLYIGDLFQLPPVMPDSQWSLLRQYYDSPFFFHARVVAEAPPVYIELKKIYRQSQQHFIDILNRIRNGIPTGSDLETLNGRRDDLDTKKEGQVRYITLTTHNHKADRINADELAKLPGRCVDLKGSIEGEFPEKNLPTDTVLQLKEGAQVMFIRNDKSEERRYYNGKLAMVKEVDEDSVRVVLAGSKEELLIEQERWDNIRYSYNREDERIDEEKLGSFTQYPLRLAWAITIHKSQGLTFEHAIIDAGESFAPGQVYVALSRCTSLEGLVLRSRITSSSIATDPLVLDFARRASGEDELARLLEKEKRDFQHQQLAQNFDLRKLEQSFAAYVQYIPGKKIPDVQGTTTMARQLVRALEDMQKVASKFQQQMTALLEAEEQEKLRERVGKAIAYFSDRLTNELLTVLDQHIESVRGAKQVKKYLKYVRQLRNALARYINRLQKLQHGEVVFNPDGVEVAMASADATEKKKRSEKAKPGGTLMETLALLRQGMKPDEIARERSLAVGTIEGHMAQLIKNGSLEIHECMENDRVENIAKVIRAIDTESLQPVKQVLGDGYSYGEIRAVMNHLRYVAQEKLS